MGETSQKMAVVPTYTQACFSLSVNANKQKKHSKKVNDSHFVIDFFRNLKTFKMIMENLSWHVLFHQKMSHLKVFRRGRTFVTFDRYFFFRLFFVAAA